MREGRLPSDFIEGLAQNIPSGLSGLSTMHYKNLWKDSKYNKKQYLTMLKKYLVTYPVGPC